MADGRFAESLDFAARPAGAAEGPRGLELQIQGSVDGRVALFGAKVDSNGVLRLGLMQEGDSVHATMVMKISDERPALAVRRIETEPEFMHVRITPYKGPSATVGLYRVEVEIPAQAPSCNYMGEQAGIIRLKTDHPKLPVIEWKVEFARVASESHAPQMAGR